LGEVVQVEEAARLIEATTNQVTSTFSRKETADLPLSGGGFNMLALFVPGIADSGSNSFSNNNRASFSSNGFCMAVLTVSRAMANPITTTPFAGSSISLGNQDFLEEVSENIAAVSVAQGVLSRSFMPNVQI
jgi:hypothetical protein